MMFRLFVFYFMIIEIFRSSTVLARRGERKRENQVVEVSQPLVSAYRKPSVRIFPRKNTKEVFLKEGENMTLRCEASGHPKPDIFWTFSSSSLKKKIVNKRSPRLFVSGVTRQDRSFVTCTARNGIGNLASDIRGIKVLYLDPPTLTVKVSRGGENPTSIWNQNSVYFWCQVESHAQVSFTWTINGYRVPMENKKQMFKEAFGSSRFVSRLTIKNAKPSDEGRYECTASLGDLGRQFNIPDTKASFNYRPNIEPAQARILSNSSVVVNKGERIEIECRAAAGVPTPTLKWIGSDDKILSQKTTARNLLVIENASYSDTGSYFCEAFNRVGLPSKEEVKVFVRRLKSLSFWITPQKFVGSPNIPRWRLVENSDVRLTCHADADPNSELVYSWYKMNFQQERVRIQPSTTKGLKISFEEKKTKKAFTIPAMSSRLEIKGMSHDKYGVYVCSATLRGFQNKSIEVNASIPLGRDSAPSQISAVSPSPLEVVEGNSVTLRCKASSMPKPLILFYKADNGTMPSGRKVEVSEDGNLLLTNVTRGDEGFYLCRAARYNGFTRKTERQTEAYIDLSVLTPPSVYQTYHDVRKPLNSTLDMTCFVTHAKPIETLSFQWFKDGVAQGKTSINDQIKILSVGENHYGVYLCNVSNNIGYTSCTFNVSNKPYPPEFYYLNPRPLVTEKKNMYSYVISWTQKLPEAVDPVIAYKIRWRLRDLPKWVKNIKKVPGGAKYGQLISYKIKNLKTGVYEVEVTPMTNRSVGDVGKRFIDVHLRPLREIVPTSSIYNLSRPFFCPFSNLQTCNFTQSPSSDMRWVLNSRKNLIRRTKNTGPEADHSEAEEAGGYYYIESTNKKRGSRARLISPRFVYPDDSKGYCLKFYYHMKGKHIGRLRILLLNSTSNGTVLWSREKEQGSAWLSALQSFFTRSDYQIVFETTVLQDNGYLGDIAIDDILLEPSQCILPPPVNIPSERVDPPGGGSESSTRATSFSLFLQMKTIYFQTFSLCLLFNFIVTANYIIELT